MEELIPHILRGSERIAVVLSAAFFGYLGYRLYVLGLSSDPTKFNAKTKVGSFLVSGMGPGLAFMSFGACVLIAALFTGGVKTEANGHSQATAAQWGIESWGHGSDTFIDETNAPPSSIDIRTMQSNPRTAAPSTQESE